MHLYYLPLCPRPQWQGWKTSWGSAVLSLAKPKLATNQLGTSYPLAVAMLQSCNVAMLQLYNVSMLQSCKIAKLQSYNVAMIQCCNVALLQCYKVKKLQSCNAAMLHIYKVVKLQSCNIAMLQCCKVVKLQCCIVAMLQSCNVPKLVTKTQLGYKHTNQHTDEGTGCLLELLLQLKTLAQNT